MSSATPIRVTQTFHTNYFRAVDFKKLRFIHRHLGQARAKRVLELGCGRGDILMTLGAYRAVGVEISREESEFARANCRDVRTQDALSYHDGTQYDAVIASEMISYVPRPLDLFRNVARNLRPGGLFLLTLPNGYGPWEFRAHHLNPKAYFRRWNFLAPAAPYASLCARRRPVGVQLVHAKGHPGHGPEQRVHSPGTAKLRLFDEQ